MTRLVRIVGFLMIGAGTLVVVVWAIKPLRFIWPWLRRLPWPIQLGFSIAAVGLVVLMASVIWERLEDRQQEGDLLDET